MLAFRCLKLCVEIHEVTKSHAGKSPADLYGFAQTLVIARRNRSHTPDLMSPERASNSRREGSHMTPQRTRTRIPNITRQPHVTGETCFTRWQLDGNQWQYHQVARLPLPPSDSRGCKVRYLI